jgi:7-cyano-7-deazaguanine synthase
MTDRDVPVPRRAVVLLSGGLDSAVTAAWAASDGFEVHALTVRYGQRHAVEVDAARRVAAALTLASHTVVDLDLRAIGGSALTADVPVPKDGPSPGIPATYVPARNTVLLALALGHAEVLGARDVWIGVSCVDYSGYPDCRPAFVEAFERLAQTATRAAVEEGRPFRMHAPLLRLGKGDTVRRGLELGVDFSLTHSCYDPAPDGAACGACDSCRLRRDGFRAAGTRDPTRYAADRTPPASLRVVEIHRAIQGETTTAGRPCVLVRLAGCPLRCNWCDTSWAREAEGTEMGAAEILDAVREIGLPLVVVTGGEPLAQPPAFDLLRGLADAGFEVQIETSGAVDVSAVDPRVRRIIDVKCPGSGMDDRNRPENLAVLRPRDELKFVLADRADYEWAAARVRNERLSDRCTVLFSAVHDRLPARELAEWILADALPVRLQLQLHRILWPDRERGA